MNNNEMKALSELKEAIDGVKSNNQTSISTEVLSNYLNQLIAETELANNATQHQAAYSQAKENFEHKMEVWRVTAPLHNSHQIEMFKSVIEAGGSALKAGMLANGGAAIALLAFVGNAVARADSTISTFSIGLLSNAMLIFFIGSWLSASAYGLDIFANTHIHMNGTKPEWVFTLLPLYSESRHSAFSYGVDLLLDMDS